MLSGLDDCIVCVCYWLMGAMFRGDRQYQLYLDDMFGTMMWTNVHRVYDLPYKNPFSFEFTEAHFKSKAGW